MAKETFLLDFLDHLLIKRIMFVSITCTSKPIIMVREQFASKRAYSERKKNRNKRPVLKNFLL